jgi:hypothetical protein
MDGFLVLSLFLASLMIVLTSTSIMFFILSRNFPPLKSGGYSLTITKDVFEVEFVDESGESVALCPLARDHFIVIWQAEREQEVPLAEQVAQVVALLPQQAGTEVLDLARFLSLRQAHQVASSPSLAV